VSAIFPGAIGEAGWADAAIPTPRTVRLRSPEDVSRAVIHAIEHDRAEIEVANPAVRLAAQMTAAGRSKR
jgi:hypothetical protein